MGQREYEEITGSLSPPRARPVSKTQALIEHIVGWIERGELGPGDRLPSTSALCRQFGVSVEVVRGAMLWLKGRGLVKGVPGVCVYVAERAGRPQ